MPRLASQAIGQYYPTPPRTIELIADKVDIAWPDQDKDDATGREKITIFDPCCGQGKAVDQLAQLAGNRDATLLYGIELNYGRAKDAATRMNHVLASDIFGSAITNEAFDILFLNPPYDFDPESKRAELAFLERCHRYLKPNGLLVYLIPQQQLELTAHTLAENYSQIQTWSMQDPEYATFKQVIVMGTRRTQPGLDATKERELQGYATLRPPMLDGESGENYYITPAAPVPIGMKVTQIDQGTAMEEARDRGVLTSREFAALMTSAVEHQSMPLMPLRKGHLVSLIAAGLLNNMKLEHEDQEILVKGKSSKKKVVEVDNAQETVIRERLEKTIMYINLRTGELVKVEG